MSTQESKGLTPTELLEAATKMMKQAELKEKALEEKVKAMEKKEMALAKRTSAIASGAARVVRKGSPKRPVKGFVRSNGVGDVEEGDLSFLAADIEVGDYIYYEDKAGRVLVIVRYVTVEKADRYGNPVRLKFTTNDPRPGWWMDGYIIKAQVSDYVPAPTLVNEIFEVLSVAEDESTFTYADQDGNEYTMDLPRGADGELTADAQSLIARPPPEIPGDQTWWNFLMTTHSREGASWAMIRFEATYRTRDEWPEWSATGPVVEKCIPNVCDYSDVEDDSDDE